MTTRGSDIDRTWEWEAIKARHSPSPRSSHPPRRPAGLAPFRPPAQRRRAHHRCSDQDLLELPVEPLENRDYRGSTYFLDVGHGNDLADSDFPGLDLGEYREVLGGLHHIAISVSPGSSGDRLVAKLQAAGVETFVVNGTSVYFPGPDGERLKLLSTRSTRHVRHGRGLSRGLSTNSSSTVRSRRTWAVLEDFRHRGPGRRETLVAPPILAPGCVLLPQLPNTPTW